jgi:hypothetical protein
MELCRIDNYAVKVKRKRQIAVIQGMTGNHHVHPRQLNLKSAVLSQKHRKSTCHRDTETQRKPGVRQEKTKILDDVLP